MRVAGRRADRPGQGRHAELADVVGRLVRDEPGHQVDDGDRGRLLARLTRLLGGSAREAGPRAVLSGGWLAGLVDEIAPRLPVRDLGTLRTHHGGLTGDELAHSLVRTASRTTAAVGAAGGALASVQFAAPPTLLASPVQLAAETLAVVAVEVKLVAELHVVYGRAPLAGHGQVATAYLVSWMTKRAVAAGPALPAAGTLLRGAARTQLRRRVVRRAGRNVGTLMPMLVGAVAGAELNRRETRALGQALIADLTRRTAR